MSDQITSGISGGLSGFVIACFTALGIYGKVRSIETDLKETKKDVLFKDTFDEYKEGAQKRLEDIKGTQDTILTEIRGLKL